MANCINVNSAQYRELKRLSTLPEILLKAEIARYQDAHEGRFPTVDEIPGADSRQSMAEDLKIRKDGTSKVEDILNFTGASDLNTANIIINDKYRDLDTEITQLNKTAIIDVKQRPSIFRYTESPQRDFNFTDSAIFITKSLEKMAQTMGINIKYMGTSSLKELGILEQIPDVAQAAAFVYNGDVYVNTDVASVDSKIHELMHILLGSLRFKQPDLYMELVQSVMNLPNIEDLAVLYPNRTQTDLLEEIFVEEFSKFLSGVDNEMSVLPEDILYQINYNIIRTLDTILMGDNSVGAIDDEVLYNSSLKEVAKLVNSSTMENKAHGFLEDALIHRVMANVKQELFENGDLKEEC